MGLAWCSWLGRPGAGESTGGALWRVRFVGEAETGASKGSFDVDLDFGSMVGLVVEVDDKLVESFWDADCWEEASKWRVKSP